VIVQPNEAFQVIWIGWVVSWIAASLWSGRTEKRAATRETWIYRIVIFAGAILIAPWTAQVLGERPSWQVGYYGACALVSVILMGLALTWWARIHLGCLWSSAITRKEKHRIVETGPYAFVRHPIYTGLIIALLATAATEATLVALLGALLIVLGLWVKASAFYRLSLLQKPTSPTVAASRCSFRSYRTADFFDEWATVLAGAKLSAHTPHPAIGERTGLRRTTAFTTAM
jgi:protein-S-isoprenylcysteine O-methyltransferase Ste14